MDDLIEKLRALIDETREANKLPELMTPDDCAEYLGLTVSRLFELRKERKGPPFLHLSSRTIRYERSEVLAWARSHRVETE